MVPESKFQQRNVFELLCGGQSQYFQAPNTAEWCALPFTIFLDLGPNDGAEFKP